ncbi:GNAT family N-acetyltransferase [Aestuariivita boseongensis]|uniref:GNAT family N-acetyltransferase n=1 Tax=Aestuariivita boseongensis TaxID=1470562 RepID=UPI0006828859|nr:GNAT family N-acetyltransferase [Aestuariivita boseongensis]
MSAALHLAKPEHLDRLLPLIAAFHAEEGLEQTDEARRDALAPLLDGSPYGAVYVVGPARAPIGYVIVTFTWSMEYGGLDAMIDELYIRPAVRGRGLAGEVLQKLARMLKDAQVHAVHLEVHTDNPGAHRLYEKSGFRLREGYQLMSRVLS